MGAIGAAAMRADNKGFLQTLGGDKILVTLASINLDADQAQKDILKAGKLGYDAFLDGAAMTNPAFKPFVPLFKAIGGEFFGALSDIANPNAVILDRLSEVDKKLDAIERQITQAEEELKDHNYNVISMAFLGNKNYTVQQLNGTVRTYMGDIAHPGNTTRTDAQKLQALADMYNDTLFKNLVSAVEGATLCFTSTHKLERKTINAILSKYQDYWVKMNVVNACVKGAGNENKLLRHVYRQSGADPENTIYDIHLLTFQSR